MFKPIACFCTFGPSMLDFGEYLVLPFQNFRFDEFSWDLLIVNRIVSKARRLHFSRFTDSFQIIQDIIALFNSLIDDLSLTFFKTFNDDFATSASSSLLDSGISGFIKLWFRL